MNKSTLGKFLPLSARFNKDWISENSFRENELHNLESLCEIINLKPGMRILDTCCEKAVSAIFLAKEFNVKVWAVDSVINPSDNLKRVKEMGCEENVFPMKLDERLLPFPSEYFDLIISVNSFMNYRTDFEFTSYISNFLKPGGLIGIVDLCSSNESTSIYKSDEYYPVKIEMDFVHSLEWWKNLWNNDEKVNVKISEIVPENEFMKRQYIQEVKNTDRTKLLAKEFKNDTLNSLNIFRMVARKTDRIYDYSFYGY